MEILSGKASLKLGARKKGSSLDQEKGEQERRGFYFLTGGQETHLSTRFVVRGEDREMKTITPIRGVQLSVEKGEGRKEGRSERPRNRTKGRA